MKIANRISLSFLILITLITVIASSIIYLIAKDNLRNAIYAQLEITVQQRSRNLETYLEMLKVSTVQFSNSVVLENLLKALKNDPRDSKEAFDIAMKRLRMTKEDDPEIYEFLLLDASGMVVASTDEGSIGLDKSKDEYFLNAGKNVFIKDAYYSEQLKERLIAVSAPFLDSNTSEFIGVLVARIKMAGIDKLMLESAGVTRSGEVYIVNRNGFMITPSKFLKDTFLKQRVDISGFKKGLLDRQVTISTDYRGVKVLGSHVYIPEMQWYLLAQIDEKEAFAPLAKLYILFLAILFTVPLFAYLLSMYLTKVIVDPIYKLQKGMEIVGQGNLEHKVATAARDEIGQLSRAFDKMIGNLQMKEAKLITLNRAVEQSPAAVTITDENGIITYVNPKFEEMAGYSAAEVIGRNPSILKSGQQGPEFYKVLWETILSGRTWHGEFHNRKKNGSLYWESAYISAVRDLKGEITNFIAVKEDVTERKKMLEELENKNRELLKLDTLKTEFVSVVSHELRTPLSIIKEGVSLVLDGVIGEINSTQNKILTTSRDNIDRLARIINSLLDISKIESGKVELKKKSVDTRALIKNVVSLFEAKAQEKGLEVKVSLPPEGALNLYIDEDRIIQVFTNLIGNSLKFTEKGHIGISLVDKGKEFEFAVSDTGIGISAEDLPKVFKKFMQFGRVAGNGEKGTGLGLSIAKGLIELHNGSIRVESESGKGSKFIFTLPKQLAGLSNG
ncbi:MAG: ATP-binding protein [Candidatus Omnitrophica bacterium]|nr:ATP-binding protein [Candidatus Omnitrophota bacterium]